VSASTDEEYMVLQKFQHNYEDSLRKQQILMEKLEVTEKKRSDILSQNKEILLSKLELEAALKNEKRRLKEVLDGKGNAILKDKIAALEGKIFELTQKEALVRQKERAQQKKLDEANGVLDQAKTEFKAKQEDERKRFAERVDKMKLELTEA